MSVWPGRPFPLGATWDGHGTNFSIFSENAERVQLCLFEEPGEGAPPADEAYGGAAGAAGTGAEAVPRRSGRPGQLPGRRVPGLAAGERRIEMEQRTAHQWHCYLPGVGPGQRYGFRVYGLFAPEDGHRFNPARLLIDPYAKSIDGTIDWDGDANVLPYVPTGEQDADLELDDEDDAAAVPKSIVVDPEFDWEGDQPPGIPFSQTVIYETHVKGFTRLHPGVREDLRGTYAGLASEAALGYLVDLGVTAVELLPVHHFSDEEFLHGRELTNYWGYSPIGFFAPHSEYAATGRTGEQVREFKGMVKALHRAGIEVILDVVYNHTAEGDHLGPMLSFKGVDNRSYYRLMPDDLRHYMDFTGTGNSLNPVHPSVLRLIMDSLRYWVVECHVDGFRFDLAAALARELFDVDRLSAFFDVIHQDPILSQVKLIAEPWDVGPGGYQVGNFPILWSEWNGVYRDVVRDFWRGRASCGEFAFRLSGSSDLYEADGRDPFASINFVTCHDGFTLADLVSYEHKLNQANREENRDGTDDNRSWNCGQEGPSEDPQILALRARQQRNFLITLFVSQGTPMLLGGDEMGRSQGGNNNPWCQDNETSWYDWAHRPEAEELREFTRRLIRLRRLHPVFHRQQFLRGRELRKSGLPDVWWFRADGMKMTRRDWQQGEPVLGMFLNGLEIPTRGPRGEAIEDDSFLLIFNACPDEREVMLPRRRFGAQWTLELCSEDPGAQAGSRSHGARTPIRIVPHSTTILKRVS